MIPVTQASSKARRVAMIRVLVLAFYVATVGAVAAIGRHIEDGKLQSLRTSSIASRVLELYELPARSLGRFPPLGWLFELSAEFWCSMTDAPETTG